MRGKQQALLKADPEHGNVGEEKSPWAVAQGREPQFSCGKWESGDSEDVGFVGNGPALPQDQRYHPQSHLPRVQEIFYGDRFLDT